MGLFTISLTVVTVSRKFSTKIKIMKFMSSTEVC
jgi:hypothetical protein